MACNKLAVGTRRVACLYTVRLLRLLRCDSVEKLKSKVTALEPELKEPLKFKDFYNFTFNYAKNPGQKGLGE